MAKIAIITGSTRSPRVGPKVAEWVYGVLEARPSGADNLEIEPLAVADFNLPVFDESVMPAMVPAQGQFVHEHSKAWSAAVQSFDGYIWVVPEYNFGMAGGTKNAIDYLYNDQIGKAAVVVTYGVQGGEFASKQLTGTLEGMKLKVASTKVKLPFAGGQGPDLFAAAGQGVLAETTTKEWAEKGFDKDVLKAWDELKDLLEQKAKEDAEAPKN